MAGRVTGLPVVYFDERYTSVEAEHRLLDAGLTRQNAKALRDKLAAQIMLQATWTPAAPRPRLQVCRSPIRDEVES